MKILTVFTGGTIGSSIKDGVISPDTGNSYLLLDMYSEIDGQTEFVTAQPFSILSENICEQNMVGIYDCILQNYVPDLDGIIVTHGTDTLQYTAAFLSYAFGICETPVVIVSANYPLADKRSNGLSNFSAAVDFIKSKQGRGVFVAYTNSGEAQQIHRASRVLTHLPYSDLIFSVFNQPYGQIRNGNFIKNNGYFEKADDAGRIFPSDGFLTEKVISIKAVPNGDYGEVSADLKAVLIETFHSGTLNTASPKLVAFCRKAGALNVPVFLAGVCKGFNYESKSLFQNLGLRVLPAASPIAMYIKLKMLASSDFDKLYLSVGGDLVE